MSTNWFLTKILWIIHFRRYVVSYITRIYREVKTLEMIIDFPKAIISKLKSGAVLVLEKCCKLYIQLSMHTQNIKKLQNEYKKIWLDISRKTWMCQTDIRKIFNINYHQENKTEMILHLYIWVLVQYLQLLQNIQDFCHEVVFDFVKGISCS